MTDLTTADRKHRSAIAPKCRCGNQATHGHETCSRCRQQDEEYAESLALKERVYKAETLEELHAVIIELAERIL